MNIAPGAHRHQADPSLDCPPSLGQQPHANLAPLRVQVGKFSRSRPQGVRLCNSRCRRQPRSWSWRFNTAPTGSLIRASNCHRWRRRTNVWRRVTSPATRAEVLRMRMHIDRRIHRFVVQLMEEFRNELDKKHNDAMTDITTARLRSTPTISTRPRCTPNPATLRLVNSTPSRPSIARLSLTTISTRTRSLAAFSPCTVTNDEAKAGKPAMRTMSDPH